jgi:hypothetical protein
MHDVAFDPGQIVVSNQAVMSLAGQVRINATGGQQGTMYVLVEGGGTLVRSGAGSTADLFVDLLNRGTVEVQSGTLRLFGGTTESGLFNVAAGATLDLNVGTHKFQGASRITGTGNLEGNGLIVNIGAGTTTIIDTSYTNTSLLVRQGTLEFTGSVTNGGQMQVDAGATLTISGNLTNYDPASHTLRPVLANNFASFIVGGTLRVANADIVTNRVEIRLLGPSSQFLNHTTGGDALVGLAEVAGNGWFNISEGRNFTTTGAFTNSGRVSVGPGSTLTAAGQFANNLGSLFFDVRGAVPANYGRVVVTGAPGFGS